MEAAPARPLRVLVVDDHASARVGLARTVALLGHTPAVAEDGEQALTIHACSPAGDELVRRIRAVGGDDRYTYIVMTTVYGVTPIVPRPNDPSRPAFQLYAEIDIPVLAVGAVFAAARVIRTQKAYCAPLCDRSELNGLDRVTAGRYDTKWALPRTSASTPSWSAPRRCSRSTRA